MTFSPATATLSIKDNSTLKRRKPPARDQAIQSALARRGFTNGSISTLLHARKLLVVALASAVFKLAQEGEVDQLQQSEVTKRDVIIQQLRAELGLLRARISRIEAKHRSRYKPEERFQILVHKETYALSLEAAASLFQVSAQTIKRWYDEAVKEPAKKTVGSLLKAVPPVLRYSDVTRNLVCLMDQMGFGGCKRIAQSLTRAGIKLSRETVRRYRKQPRKPEPRPDLTTIERVLKAKSPNHIWMMDITEIPSAFRLFTFKFVVLLDVFSRFPVAAKLFFKEPTAREVAEMIRTAVKKHGGPKYYVSDHGSQFTSDHFRAALKRLGISQRFGAIGKYGSIAIIERLWRTLKDLLLLRSRRAWSPAEMMRRLDDGLYYYAFHKPHQGLAGATPSEVYFGLQPVHLKARRPPCEYEVTSGKKRDRSLPEIVYLDQEHLLPILVPKKKAA